MTQPPSFAPSHHLEDKRVCQDSMAGYYLGCCMSCLVLSRVACSHPPPLHHESCNPCTLTDMPSSLLTRVLLIWSDERIALLQQSTTVWSRDEGLSGVTAALFTDLPAAAAAGSPGGPPSFNDFLKLQILSAKAGAGSRGLVVPKYLCTLGAGCSARHAQRAWACLTTCAASIWPQHYRRGRHGGGAAPHISS
jgi:hypothetical protein